VDWTATGIPGGIPSGSWTQSGSTISPSGGNDSSAIQTALNACGTNHFVLLSSGTFKINTALVMKNNCVLRGAGGQLTILTSSVTSGGVIEMGAFQDSPYNEASTPITSGATAGSTSIVLGTSWINGTSVSAAPPQVGGLYQITELNDPRYVTADVPQNAECTYCDGSLFNGTRLRGQTVHITTVSGSNPYTITFDPPLYTSYGSPTQIAWTSGSWPNGALVTNGGTLYACTSATCTGTPANGTNGWSTSNLYANNVPYATPFGPSQNGTPDITNSGVEDLQIYATGTGLGSGVANISIWECSYCWVLGVESNYTDADHVDLYWCFRCEVRNNYFDNAFGHGAGGSDADVQLATKTSGTLVANNIFERLHSSLIASFGASGNVVAYNYCYGGFDATAYNVNVLDLDNHGPQPEFNLFEGNDCINFTPDSFHGSEGYQTFFRNWLEASSTIASYPVETLTSVTESSGTCTLNISGTNYFQTGNYVYFNGVSGSSLSGNQYQLASPTTITGCPAGAAGTGGTAYTFDLVANSVPITHLPIAWTNTHLSTQQNWSFPSTFVNVGSNVIGNVFGSANASTTVGGSGNFYNSGSGCTSCIRPSATRNYTGNYYASSFGYDTGADSSGSGVASFVGGQTQTAGYWVGISYNTTCYSGNYDMASASRINNINCTTSSTLPASFWTSSQPAWWATAYGTPAWPAIGPDVSGGSDSSVAGHANKIPARLCYEGLSRDSTGAKEFDANTCYTTSSTYTITVSSIIGSGTVTSSDSVINCTTGTTGTCSDSSASGTVTLTETPSSGYVFSSWGGGTCSGSSTTCSVSSAATVTATFVVSSSTPPVQVTGHVLINGKVVIQ
jgi:hypothetical protein